MFTVLKTVFDFFGPYLLVAFLCFVPVRQITVRLEFVSDKIAIYLPRIRTVSHGLPVPMLETTLVPRSEGRRCLFGIASCMFSGMSVPRATTKNSQRASPDFFTIGRKSSVLER